MLEVNLCDKCENIMSTIQIKRSEGGKITNYCCLNCGYNYEAGFRFNKEIKQFVKYLRVL